jgi:hypothetical protein
VDGPHEPLALIDRIEDGDTCRPLVRLPDQSERSVGRPSGGEKHSTIGDRSPLSGDHVRRLSLHAVDDARFPDGGESDAIEGGSSDGDQDGMRLQDGDQLVPESNPVLLEVTSGSAREAIPGRIRGQG